MYPKQYLSSGFLSIQSAVDGYVMGAAPEDDSALEVPPTGNGSSSAFTEWASPFPTAAYIHNRFYDGGLPMAACPAFPIALARLLRCQQLGCKETLLVAKSCYSLTVDTDEPCVQAHVIASPGVEISHRLCVPSF